MEFFTFLLFPSGVYLHRSLSIHLEYSSFCSPAYFFLNSGKTTCSICCVYKTCSPHNYNKTYNFKILFIHLSLPLANIFQSMYLRMIVPQKKKSLLKKKGGGVSILKTEKYVYYIPPQVWSFLMYMLKTLRNSSKKKPS